jgi:ribosomal protein S8E
LETRHKENGGTRDAFQGRRKYEGDREETLKEITIMMNIDKIKMMKIIFKFFFDHSGFN